MPRRAALLASVLLAACRQDMHDQPRFEPLEHSDFFADGRSERPRIPGTVSRDEGPVDELLLHGKVGGVLATQFPFPITERVMARGRERFEIFCSPCHDRAGYGEGAAVLRGMKQPPSFHVERLRNAAPGYFFDVITNGFGAMYDLSDRIPPEDRWAIVAYVRALQQSQNATLADLSADERARLEALR